MKKKKMSNYVNNLNELINTKNEFKEIIIESGQTPGEVFSYYPNMIRNAIAAGGGSLVDYPTYTYVATYYPDFTYLFSYVGDALSGIDVDIDLSSYVTKDELSAQSYVTSTDLENASYVTNTYVSNNYVKKGADITTPVAAIGNLRVEGELKVNADTYSYNIIPQADNMYDIGSNSYRYNTVNTQRINNSNTLGGIKLSLNNTDFYSIRERAILPETTSYSSLGSNYKQWYDTYTANIYSSKLFDSENSANSIQFSNNAIRLAYNDVGFYLDNTGFRPGTNGNKLLGTSSNYWGITYTTNIYTGNVSYTSGKSSIKMNDRNVDIYANNKKMINLSDYNGLVPIQTNVNLGGSSNKWAYTYTSYLILNGTDIMDIIGDVETLLANI